jgi:simple sugar transport system substrate-binding protein
MATTHHKKLRFIFITCAVGEAFFRPVKQGMADAARMMGVECDFIGTEDVDLKAQAGMVTQAVTDGYDGIALNIIDPEVFNGVVADAIAKGLPVVAFNVDGTYGKGPHLSSINQNLYAAGRTVGKQAASALPDNVKVLLTVHSEGISALEDRLRGIQDILKTERNATWKVVVTGIHEEQAAEVIAKALKADPAMRAVLCTGQADTQGAGLAVERYFQHAGIYVAGFDLTPEILRMVKAGMIAFTIDQQPYVQGFYPVLQLAIYCRYGIKPSSMDAGATVITKNDVDRVMQLSAEGYR